MSSSGARLGVVLQITSRFFTSLPPRQVADRIIILNLESGTYFELDDVGVTIWQSLAAGQRVADIRAAVLADFDVEKEILDRDLAEFLQTLEGRGLIGPGSAT